jgi:heat shock protein HslJ
MQRESAYLADLGKVDSYSVDGPTLTLGGSGVKLEFTAEAAPAQLPLVGTRWRLATLFSGATATTPVGGFPTALFAGSGAVSGGDGCNRYHASYSERSDGSMEVGPLASTQKMCEPSVMDQADAFTRGMSSTASYRIEDSVLTLLDQAGNPLLAFEGSARS